jgi:hypothetical protein
MPSVWPLCIALVVIVLLILAQPLLLWSVSFKLSRMQKRIEQHISELQALLRRRSP